MFDGKLVFITGGSSGIGLSLAKAFADMRAHVWILGRRNETLEIAIEQIKKCRKSERQVIGKIQGDVADENTLQTTITSFISNVGVPDIIINSAGEAHPGHFEELDYSIFRRMIEINYLGTVLICKLFIPDMIKHGSGHIVNISSIAGFMGVYGYSAYGPSKFAVRGFSDILRSELKDKNINVHIAFPPDTDTPQLEYEKQYKPQITSEISGNANIMSPDDVAIAIIKGIQSNKYIILPGFEARIVYFLNNILGKYVYLLMDILVKRAARNVRKY